MTTPIVFWDIFLRLISTPQIEIVL
jgi:hypothetical protein